MNNEGTDGFTVMTFNLRFGLADDGDNAWQNRQKAYPLFFERYQPDFVGFQEANSFQTDFLDNLLTEHSYTGKREPSPEFWQDNPLFFRKEWRCLAARHFFLTETPEKESLLPESKWPRQCVIGHFEKAGRELIHANTHFDFKTSVQKRSAEFVTEFLKDYPKDIPVILTGDFNAPPFSPAYNIFMENGFRDVFTGGHESTFHGFKGGNSGDPIDWILYRGDFKVVSATVVRDSFSGIFPSDHYQVLSEFSFGENIGLSEKE